MDGTLKNCSYFASAERDSAEQVRYQTEFVMHHPVMGALLSMSNGLLAVLNQHRQILAVNHNFLEMLGLRDQAKALGTASWRGCSMRACQR